MPDLRDVPSEARYGIAGRAAGEAVLRHGRDGARLRSASDAFLLSRIARAVVDALDEHDRAEVERLKRENAIMHTRTSEPFDAFVRRVAPEHAVLILFEYERLQTQVLALENAGMEQAAKLGEAEAEVERLREALEGIKARCDRIVAGEFGGLQAATEIANEARRALASKAEHGCWNWTDH